MKHCKYCGRELNDSAEFCKYCGKRLKTISEDKELPKTSTEKRPKSKSFSVRALIITIVACAAMFTGILLLVLNSHKSIDKTDFKYRSDIKTYRDFETATINTLSSIYSDNSSEEKTEDYFDAKANELLSITISAAQNGVNESYGKPIDKESITYFSDLRQIMYKDTDGHLYSINMSPHREGTLGRDQSERLSYEISNNRPVVRNVQKQSKAPKKVEDISILVLFAGSQDEKKLDKEDIKELPVKEAHSIENIVDHWAKEYGIQVDYRESYNTDGGEKGKNLFTIKDLKTILKNYDIINIVAHGIQRCDFGYYNIHPEDHFNGVIMGGVVGAWKVYRPCFMLQEKVTAKTEDEYKDDRSLHIISEISPEVKYGDYRHYVVLPSFFEKYYGNKDLEGKTIILSSCKSMGNNKRNESQANTFIKCGAQAVTGYQYDVTFRYAYIFNVRFVSYLLDGLTIQDAFDRTIKDKEVQKIYKKDEKEAKEEHDKVYIPVIIGDRNGRMCGNDVPTPTPIPDLTPTPTPTPTPIPAASATTVPNTNSKSTRQLAYDAYLKVLESNKKAIDSYDWMNAFSKKRTNGKFYFDPCTVQTSSNKKCALCELTGDSVPELLFISSSNKKSKLHVYTYNKSKKQAVEILSLSVDSSSLPLGYALYRTSDNKLVYFYNHGTGNGDDGGCAYVYKYSGSKMKRLKTYTSVGSDQTTYKINKKKYSYKSFIVQKKKLVKSTNQVIFYSVIWDTYNPGLRARSKKLKSVALTYESCKKTLKG